jgi:hypothetical protein
VENILSRFEHRLVKFISHKPQEIKNERLVVFTIVIVQKATLKLLKAH